MNVSVANEPFTPCGRPRPEKPAITAAAVARDLASARPIPKPERSVMDYRFQWCESLSAPDFPVQAYVQLCERLPHSTPFNHLGWLRAAENGLEPDQTLHVLLGWSGDQLLLCLPLIRLRESRFGLIWHTLRHLGYPMSDRLALLCQLDDQGLVEALGAIRRQLPHTLLQLNELTTDAHTQRYTPT